MRKARRGSEREEREYRAEDERIKNLPKGQMQILMTDDTEGHFAPALARSATSGCRPFEFGHGAGAAPAAVPGGRRRGQPAVQEPGVGRAIRSSSARKEVVVTLIIRRNVHLTVLLGSLHSHSNVRSKAAATAALAASGAGWCATSRGTKWRPGRKSATIAGCALLPTCGARRLSRPAADVV